MKQLYTSHFKIFIIFLFGFVMLVFPKISNAQNTGNEQVKRLQRAIYIFNFAQQVNWKNQDNIQVFEIGVLGPDRTIIDLKSLAQKRQIHGKNVKVKHFSSVKEVKNIQLLYVNKSFNFDIDYILNKISSKNILLVSEDYDYNASMINMVGVGDSFEYETNEKILNNENFTIANSLRQHAVSSSEKWKKLFKSSEASLEASKQSEAQKQAELNEKVKAIQNQKDTISAQQDSINAISTLANKRKEWIDLLSSESNLQKQELSSKIALERELEQVISSQLETLKIQESKIKKSTQRLKSQSDSIAFQTLEIKEKAATLESKDERIKSQRKFNYLLIALITLALLGSLLIYINYNTKKKLAQKLKEKNTAILKQSIELEAKNNELEQFAYIASHDLKEPLITISSLIDLLVEDYEDKFDEDGRTSLNFIQDSSNRMKKLIDAILAYSRLGKSKDYTAINCNLVLDTLKGDLQNAISRTNSQIIINTLPVINGAELEIRLLFQNLISNGIKFTKPNEPPIIEISANKININTIDFWQFAIKDNGIGIPEKHQERIFSIFQRLHSREEYEGTGIGLAHCKKIVESHGGSIWLTSEENIGTTFFFTVPCLV